MDVYLDHHATTPCRPDVVEAMLPWFTHNFGNPASRSHRWGISARAAVEGSRGALAQRLDCSPKALVFTSGATEANNLAILGVLRANRRHRDHLVVSAIEHKSVLDAAKAAEREGFRVTRVMPNPEGLIEPEAFRAALTDHTLLASVMWVNNEIGTIQPIQALGALCRERGVLFHTDAAQAPSWLPLQLRSLPVDLASFSAHKVYGPKGIGALYVRRGRPKLELTPLQFGGGHERGLRSGTLPVPLIVGFAQALRELDLSLISDIASRRDQLQDSLLELGGIRVNGSRLHRVAGNLSLSIDGIDVKALMLAMPELGISSGSACTSESLAPSHVLQAIGLSKDEAASTLRIGLGHSTSEQEIQHAISVFTTAIRTVRALERSNPK